MENLFLLILIVLFILQPLLFKVASNRLDYRLGPIYFSFWVLIGLGLTYPFFSDLLHSGIESFFNKPSLVVLSIIKGVLMWRLIHGGMALSHQSLSAKSYTLPTALGLIAITNSFLGEDLNGLQWISAIGLCVLGIGFSFHGHLQELGRQGRRLYLELVLIALCTASLDQMIIPQSNWYVLLLVSNIALFIICLFTGLSFSAWRKALTEPSAILAGISFAASELFKFFIMITILPMSVVISGQVSTIPLVLVLGALIWKERTWQEQLIWGILSAGFLFLLFL